MNNVSNDEIMKRVARIVRAGRKQASLTQVELSDQLQLEQSALSRIESGKQVLSAPQFYHFCNIVGVSPDSLITGYIEYPKAAKLNNEVKVGDFKVPKKYQKYKGSKVRAMLPFIQFIQSKYGEAAFETLLDDLKFDPDYFINLDNQVNFSFFLDLLVMVMMKGDLNAKALSAILEPVNSSLLHGRLNANYEDRNDSIELLETIITRAGYYECNFNYSVIGKTKNSLDLSITANNHMSEFDYRSNKAFGEFICKYKKGYFKRFSTYGGNKGVAIEEVDCLFKGDSKCVYEIKTL